MRIVVDMQGAQAGSRQRGIGRYTLSLAQAIARNRGQHEVVLALNGTFSESIEAIRAAFDDLLPQENIRVWHAPGPVCQQHVGNDWRRRSAELVREAFLASLKPDFILVSSLFEGLSDDVVTSVGTLRREVPTAVILYDLIPLIQRKPYLENPVVESWYEGKLGHLRRADLLLAISESSRQEGIRHLGFPEEACFNISAAADPQFRPVQVEPAQQQEIRRRYGLTRPFVMYTGGIDHRKNIEGLITAYARLPKPVRAGHQLAIVCSVQHASRSALETHASKAGLGEDELVLTGFVPDADLLTLYNLCKAFVFPSWHEGFGLPALEAMSCGRAVIGANTSSLPEVIGCTAALFDPLDAASIADKLEQVLTDQAFRHQLEVHGLERARAFSWDTSALAVLDALEGFAEGQLAARHAKNARAPRPRLAYVSPLPPERSGISDYSAELIPELARHYDIEVISDQGAIAVPWLAANCPMHTVEWFRENALGFDRVVYQFGNSAYHQHMFSLLEAIPGVVVLHDFFLSGIISHMEYQGTEPGMWVRELYAAHGYPAVQKRFHAEDATQLLWDYPCNLSVLRNARGVVVHSDNSRRLAARWYGERAAEDWALIPLLRFPEMANAKDRSRARAGLGFNEGQFLVCSFGLLAHTKLNHRLLDAWLASALAADDGSLLVFVGEFAGGDYGEVLRETMAKSPFRDRIRVTGWVDADGFRQYLAAADVGVQLRTLSRGETSGAVLDCMNYGLATIVNAHGSMVDLADDGVWKLPDEFEDAQLVDALEALWRNPQQRLQLGAVAKEIVLTRHGPRVCADLYKEAIEEMYGPSRAVLPDLIRSLAELECSLQSPSALADLADAIAASIPDRLVPRQMLLDISPLMESDSETSARRAMRIRVQALLGDPPEGYRVEPVYAMAGQGYRYARRFTLRLLECPQAVLDDDLIGYQAGDIFLVMDPQEQADRDNLSFHQLLSDHGVHVGFVIHDPMPAETSESSTARPLRIRWLRHRTRVNASLP